MSMLKKTISAKDLEKKLKTAKAELNQLLMQQKNVNKQATQLNNSIREKVGEHNILATMLASLRTENKK